MRRTVLAVVVPAALFVVDGTRIALATPGSGLTSLVYPPGNFGRLNVEANTRGFEFELQTEGRSDVYVVHNTFAAGAHTGWHTHPGPSLIIVKSGTITAYDANCKQEVYPEGAGFVDPGGDHVHLLRNEGSGTAETVAVQFLPDGAERRIDAPAPANCH
jgi:quercetin dioxygenase-like cupin family protein